MAKLGKKYQEVAKLVDSTKKYSLEEAVELVKKTATTKFDDIYALPVTPKAYPVYPIPLTPNMPLQYIPPEVNPFKYALFPFPNVIEPLRYALPLTSKA